MTAKILIVDDEADIRNLIQGILEDEGYDCTTAQSAKTCDECMDAALPDLVILDIWLQGSEHDGMDILKKVKQDYPMLPVIMISGHGTIETAVQAIKMGAYDFIEKPFKSDRLLLMIKRGLENAALLRENTILKEGRKPGMSLIGTSAATQNLDAALRKAAQGKSRVVLTGERGTGKEMAAGLLHGYSDLVEGPFIALNCCDLTSDNGDKIVFGEDHVIGAVEQAQGGSLYLGNITHMPETVQEKLIKAMRDGDLNDVRLIVGAPAQGAPDSLRDDLWALLNITHIEMPSLKARRDDIPALLSHFMRRDVEQIFTPEALEKLQHYAWPGNVRQLHHVADWVEAMYGEEAELFDIAHLPLEISGLQSNAAENDATDLGGDIMGLPLREARELFEKEYLLSQIERFEGNISKTAQFIGMERSALHRKIKNLKVYQENSEESSGEDLSQKDLKRA